MADVFTPQMRSAGMSRVRPRGNRTTELAFVEILRNAKIIGWRRHPAIFGHPDFVFRAYRTVVFVDGCFWHGCEKCRSVPKQNRQFWEGKFRYNRQRARIVNSALKRKGWNVVRFWEHELRNPDSVSGRLLRSLSKFTPRQVLGDRG